MRRVRFEKTSCEGASFIEADLKGAHMAIGDFRNADFRGADMTGASVYGSDFTGASYNDSTKLPYLMSEEQIESMIKM
jgi:uncharacterized protein YjbI with pentapeptide repeats